MGKTTVDTKRIVRISAEIQLPLKVGEEACYRRDGHLMFTDRVRRILEIAADYARFETSSYYYTIELGGSSGQMKLAA